MDETNKVTNTYVFEEAYPLSVGEVSMSYANEEPATCDISMTYRKYISKSSYHESLARRQKDKNEEKTKISFKAQPIPIWTVDQMNNTTKYRIEMKWKNNVTKN